MHLYDIVIFFQDTFVLYTCHIGNVLYCIILQYLFIYLRYYVAFNTTMARLLAKENQYIQFVKVLYCKLYCKPYYKTDTCAVDENSSLRIS